MNIKLISPKMSLRPMDSEFKRRMSPPISLLTIAGLTPSEHSIYIEDENVERLNFEDNPDLVGITVNVDTSCRAYCIGDFYRKKGIPVIFGGIHASATPTETLNHGDSVCIGEAENLWENIIADASRMNLKKVYRNRWSSRTLISEAPRWDLIDDTKYLYTNIVSTSRGCPFKCRFCYNSCLYMKKRFLQRPVEHIVEEIKRLNTKHVMFIDDNFIGNIKWTEKFLQAIKPLNLKWNAAVSANIYLYPGLMDLMQETGCKSLFIGFETINRSSLKSMRKIQNNVSAYNSLINGLHKRGIMVNASLVFGFDSDGPDVFKDTLQWLVGNKVETMTAHILTPYPGTGIYRDFMAHKRIIDQNPEHYNTSHVVFKPKNLTAEQLLRGYLWIYKEFYSFKNIIKRMPEKMDMRLPYLLFNLGYRKFGKISSRIASLGLLNRLGKTARRLAYGIQ